MHHTGHLSRDEPGLRPGSVRDFSKGHRAIPRAHKSRSDA